MSPPGSWRRLEASARGVSYVHLAREGSRQDESAPLLLVHGVGPGTTGEMNFRALLNALPADAPAHLIDLIGFGGSGRKPEQPGFDPDLWLEQIEQSLDRIGRPAVLIGNSVGGALALKTAARRPDLRAVLAIGAPLASRGATPELAAFWRAPRDLDALAAALRPMSAAQTPPSMDLLSERWRPFADPAYARWFDEMLARPDEGLASVALAPEEALSIRVETRILHGRQDLACPSGPVADFVLRHLPRADLILLGDCGHNLIAERTSEVLQAVRHLQRKGPGV